MARLGRLGSSCSYKKITLIICFINIVVALYVFRFLYASLYVYSSNDSPLVVRYTPDQIRKMEESTQIRRAAEPIELVTLVKEINNGFAREQSTIELPLSLKQKITKEVLLRLRSLEPNANMKMQQEEVENWRKEKLEEVKQLIAGNRSLNSTISQDEAGILSRALQSDWLVLSEDMGLWIPTPINHEEHNDKPEDEKDEDEDLLPGRPLPPECRAELHTDYGGTAVKWGLTHHKDSAADCCQACFDQAKNAKPGELKCNVWVYCPAEEGCYSPDIYEHRNQECWLKYSEKPKLNFKDRYSDEYRSSHPTAPVVVPWVSGVIGV